MKQRPPQARGWTRFGLRVAELAAMLFVWFVCSPCAPRGGLLLLLIPPQLVLRACYLRLLSSGSNSSFPLDPPETGLIRPR